MLAGLIAYFARYVAPRGPFGSNMVFFAVLLALVLPILLLEGALHRRSRMAIRHRVHVNGIRGKSSVTRLIAAGLRAGGYKTWAKVTGTTPMIVDEEGREIAIQRMNGGFLSEQRTTIALAARAGVDALVIECMAIQPQYQRVAEEAFVRSTIGVITNVRPDHLESYGDSFESIAHALANTIPHNGVLYTTPGPAVDIFQRIAGRRGSSVVCVAASQDDEADLDRFPYVEHPENLAVALAVCAQLGVDRQAALASMATSRPDSGVLRAFEARRDGRVLHVINALAANDPASTLQLYERLVAGRWDCPLMLFVNSRRDRPLRSIQLGQLVARIPASRYFIGGNDARGVVTAAREAGAKADSFLDCDGMNPAQRCERIFDHVSGQAVLFAIGNTGAGGLDTIEALAAFEQREGG